MKGLSSVIFFSISLMGLYHHSMFLFGNRVLLNHVAVFFKLFFIRVGHESEHALGLVMDRGAWSATIPGVAKSCTQGSD